MSYTLVALAFHATLSGTPVPAMTNVGQFDDAISCFWAAETMVQLVQNGPTGAVPPRNNHPSIEARVIFQCLPSAVPAACAASPGVCGQNNIPPVISNP